MFKPEPEPEPVKKLCKELYDKGLMGPNFTWKNARKYMTEDDRFKDTHTKTDLGNLEKIRNKYSQSYYQGKKAFTGPYSFCYSLDNDFALTKAAAAVRKEREAAYKIHAAALIPGAQCKLSEAVVHRYELLGVTGSSVGDIVKIMDDGHREVKFHDTTQTPHEFELLIMPENLVLTKAADRQQIQIAAKMENELKEAAAAKEEKEEDDRRLRREAAKKAVAHPAPEAITSPEANEEDVDGNEDDDDGNDEDVSNEKNIDSNTGIAPILHDRSHLYRSNLKQEVARAFAQKPTPTPKPIPPKKGNGYECGSNTECESNNCSRTFWSRTWKKKCNPSKNGGGKRKSNKTIKRKKSIKRNKSYNKKPKKTIKRKKSKKLSRRRMR